MDSLLRLRQLNQTELSGFIGRVLLPTLKTSGLSVSDTDILPIYSGTQNLGSQSLPFESFYVKNVVVPSGSGIWFGNTFLTAYTSGSNAILSVGGYEINSSPIGLSIVGPIGATGPSGATGASGLSGISITGASGYSNGTGFKLLFSNGTLSNAITLPSGASGASGISLSGFIRSGDLIVPKFSNGNTGNGILLLTGSQGIQGKAGGISFEIVDMTGFRAGAVLPKAYIDHLGITYNPTVNFVKGMAYDLTYTGLDLTGVNILGTDYRTNYFIEEGITGYLKFTLFDPSIKTMYSNPHEGRFIKDEIVGAVYNDIFDKVVTNDSIYNVTENTNRGELIFNTKLSASSELVWGFQRYNFWTSDVIDDSGPWGFYALGQANFNYFGPSGASGQQGPVGIPGAQGERGPRGLNGSLGTSITGVQRNGNDIRFLFSNRTNSDWVTLPNGGATGPEGPTGPAGPIGTQGPAGPQGATGFADRYAASFYYFDTYYNAASATFNKRPSGTLTWTPVAGTDRKFKPGDEISFYNDALVGKSYSTWQKVLFADTPYDRSQYFYATIADYNSSNGLINFIVSDNPAPLGMVGGEILWHQYNEINLNLGGLGSSGERGLIGPTGLRGDTGNAVFVINTPTSGLIKESVNTLRFNQYDGLDLFITGMSNTIIFDYNTFATGQTVLLRIHNSGLGTNSQNIPLLTWGAGEIKFPYNTQAPGPNPDKASLYTFVRFPDSPANTKRVFCTYSMEYGV